MKDDLKRKVKSHAIREGGGHLIDVEVLQPRASFTKPSETPFDENFRIIY